MSFGRDVIVVVASVGGDEMHDMVAGVAKGS